LAKKHTDFEVEAVEVMERAATDDFAELRRVSSEGTPGLTLRDLMFPSSSPVKKRDMVVEKT
jgi:hypothetical protein